VGAGPGGLDNLTVKALRLLRQCDAVVYDDLGGGEADILAEVRQGAERVSVGKRGGDKRSWRQEDINATLVRLSLQGKTVVRLKGGCPSVFSRAREEMADLTNKQSAVRTRPRGFLGARRAARRGDDAER
jgi:siroheme synthase